MQSRYSLHHKEKKINISEAKAIYDMFLARDELIQMLNGSKDLVDINLRIIIEEEIVLFRSQNEKINKIIDEYKLPFYSYANNKQLSEVKFNNNNINMTKIIYGIIKDNYRYILNIDIQSLQISYNSTIREILKEITIQTINHYEILIRYGVNKNYLVESPEYQYKS